MRVHLNHPNEAPQDFCFDIHRRAGGKVDAVYSELSFDSAAMLDMYHKMVDHLCRENGFKHSMYDAGGSCPKYVFEDGRYLYAAHNYFVEVVDRVPYVYLCEVSLGLDKDGYPNDLLFDFYDQDKKPVTNDVLTHGVSLRDLVVMSLAADSNGMDNAKDLVSYFFADSIMRLNGLVKIWGSWGYEAQRNTAFPDEMLFSAKLIEEVIAPKYALGASAGDHHDISKAVMFATNGDIGPNAAMFFMFLHAGKLKTGEISLADYLKERHASTLDPYHNIERDTTLHSLTSWADMYGIELWCSLADGR